VAVTRPKKLATLVRQLRECGVREYEEFPDGAFRLVLDERGPIAVPDAKKKPDAKVIHADPHRAARLALHGWGPEIG
jgi:hypothetical protein